MLNRKLLEVLKLLNTEERAQLGLFLKSPYFNHRGNALELIRLYEYILACDAEETHPKLSKMIVAKEFFPNKSFAEGQKGPIDTLASDLFGLVKRFMAQSAFEEKGWEFEEGIAMARFYRRYGMEERFWKIVQALRKSESENYVRDAEYFQKQFLLEEEAASFEGLNNTFEDDANIAIAVENLDASYLINKIELMCALSYQQKLSQKVIFNVSEPLAQATLNLIPSFSNIPQYKLYRLVFQLLQKPEDDEAFSKFEYLLEMHSGEIPFEKVRNLKAYYRFFWNRRYTKSGEPLVRAQIFEVYKEHYEQGYFYESGDIMINSLKVLVLLALKVGQFEWVKKVLDEHPPTRICGTKYPVEAHSLCLAEYYFYTQKYNTALETLMYKHFENPNYSLWAEMLLIKIYFETKDDLLEYRMKALEQKVRRTKLSDETKQRYYRFLQKLDKVIKYGMGKDSPKRARLVEEIKTAPGIIEREWLLEKLGEAAS